MAGCVSEVVVSFTILIIAESSPSPRPIAVIGLCANSHTLFHVRVRYSVLLGMSALFGSAGNSAVHVAIPWLVLETTGSSAQAGIVLGLSGMSVIFTAPLIGGLIAVLGARPVSVWADVISAISVLMFPIFGTLFHLNVTELLLIAIGGAMFDPAGATARKSLIQPVAEKRGSPLPNSMAHTKQPPPSER